MVRNEIIDESSLLVSPFRYSLKIRVSKMTDNGKFVVGDDGLSMPSVVYFDKANKVSYFQSKDNEDTLSLLGGASLKLFIHIMNQVEKGNDWVRINRAAFCNKYGVKSSTTFSGAINELLRYQIICGTHYKTIYWVNPSFLFNGNRVDKYSDCLDVVSEFYVNSGKGK